MPEKAIIGFGSRTKPVIDSVRRWATFKYLLRTTGLEACAVRNPVTNHAPVGCERKQAEAERVRMGRKCTLLRGLSAGRWLPAV